MHACKAVIGLAVVIPTILLVIFFAPSLLRMGVRRFSFNEEIKSCPIKKTSVTFTAWTTMKTFSYHYAREGNIFVVINYTVRNIGDTELGTDFAFADTPILKYWNYYADAKIGIVTYWSFHGTYPLELMPNQSLTNGYIYFEILEGYQPTELVFPSKESPQIIIKIS